MMIRAARARPGTARRSRIAAAAGLGRCVAVTAAAAARYYDPGPWALSQLQVPRPGRHAGGARRGLGRVARPRRWHLRVTPVRDSESESAA